MSAFIVAKEHVDLLITAGLDMPTHGYLSWNGNPDGQDWSTRMLDRANASEVGSMLWSENLASVAHRYPNDSDGERPGSIDFRDEHVITYQYEPLVGRLNPVVVLKNLDCYEYQSCEHAGWATSEARRFCDALRKVAITRLPGYDKAPWGFDDRRYFLTQLQHSK